MSQEAPQANPAELSGLTPDQQQRAAEFVQDIIHKEAHMRQVPSGNTVISAWEGDMRRGTRQLRLKAAHRAANRHYRQHKGEYQEQAFKEATEAGYDITWEYGEKVPK